MAWDLVKLNLIFFTVAIFEMFNLYILFNIKSVRTFMTELSIKFYFPDCSG
jgi:hypothetical protein